ncbi:MAG: ribonuclease [Lachnospiraceae bacterium]|nr:ribonuclease [Lachnospiraceae bacterium]
MLAMLLLGSIGLVGCGPEAGTERLSIPLEVQEAIAANEASQTDTGPDSSEDGIYQELTLIEEDESGIGEEESGTESQDTKQESAIDENGSYDSKDEVALYIHTYGKLPGNYITKKEAQALGWSGGSLSDYAPGKCIGGSYFGNYEKQLPEKNGRKYYECDIDTLGASKRGAKRIIYSNDGLIYYTGDHYETFELLYDGK